MGSIEEKFDPIAINIWKLSDHSQVARAVEYQSVWL